MTVVSTGVVDEDNHVNLVSMSLLAVGAPVGRAAIHRAFVARPLSFVVVR